MGEALDPGADMLYVKPIPRPEHNTHPVVCGTRQTSWDGARDSLEREMLGLSLETFPAVTSKRHL